MFVARGHCQQCRWYKPVNDEQFDPGKQWGYCHRFPPKNTPKFLNSTYEERAKLPLLERRHFPLVWSHDACAEWEPEPKSPEEIRTADARQLSIQGVQ